MAWLGVRPVVSWLHGVGHDLKLNSCSNYRFEDFPIPRSNTIPRADNLSIGDLSRHTGVNIETIRYYERIGLQASSSWHRGLASLSQPFRRPSRRFAMIVCQRSRTGASCQQPGNGNWTAAFLNSPSCEIGLAIASDADAYDQGLPIEEPFGGWPAAGSKVEATCQCWPC